METLGNIIVFIGIVFVAIGVIGIFRFNDFYSRLLVSAKVDTVGAITLILGLMIKHGFSFFTLKLALLLCLMLLINPLTSHFVARAAYLSGYKIKGEERGTDDA